MKKKIALLFVFNGYADWEPSFAMAEINKAEAYTAKTFSSDGESIKSMGGLTVLPDYSLTNLPNENEIAILILPGGNAWEEKKNREITELVQRYAQQNIPLAGICAATTFLAKAGILKDKKHTSNDIGYMKSLVPDYDGDAFYQQMASVTDGHIITANGTAATEFARDIFKLLHIYDHATADEWYRVFKNGVI